MHVAVVLRLVPDIAEELDIAVDGRDIDREWIGMKLNEFDDHALEQAVLLKEQVGASVTAVALDGEGTDKLLQSAIARGVERIVKCEHQLPPLPAAATVASVLAPVLRGIGADVVLTGVQTPEDVCGQLAAALGARLGWPHVSAVAGVQSHPEGCAVRQEHSGGYATRVLLRTPCVLGIQAASQPPRYVSGSRLRQAMGVKADIIGGEPGQAGPVAIVRTLAKPEASGGAAIWEGDAGDVAAQFVAVLRERGLLKA
jgi:electron transfer flavoprotein beta subunit